MRPLISMVNSTHVQSHEFEGREYDILYDDGDVETKKNIDLMRRIPTDDVRKANTIVFENQTTIMFENQTTSSKSKPRVRFFFFVL